MAHDQKFQVKTGNPGGRYVQATIGGDLITVTETVTDKGVTVHLLVQGCDQSTKYSYHYDLKVHDNVLEGTVASDPAHVTSKQIDNGKLARHFFAHGLNVLTKDEATEYQVEQLLREARRDLNMMGLKPAHHHTH